MNKFFIIFKFTYKQSIKRKGFIIMTLLGMLLMGVLLNIDKIASVFTNDTVKNIVVINESNSLNLDSKEFSTLNDSKYSFTLESDKNKIQKIKDDFNKKDSDYYGMLELKTNNDKIESNLYVKTLLDSELSNKISTFINGKVFSNKILSLNLPKEKYISLLDNIKLNVIQSQEVSEGRVILVYAMMFVLYAVMMYYGSIVANSVIEEKSNRIMETLITMANPLELFLGKVLAVCSVGLTQLLVFCGFGFSLVKICNVDTKMLSSLNVSNEIIIAFLAFFLLGYLSYSLIYGAMGSLVSSSQDATTALLPMTMLLMIVFCIAIIVMPSIDNTVPKILSYVPLASPIFMFERIAISSVSPMEIILSLVIGIFAIAIIGYLSSKVYKKGVLHYGKRMSLLKLINK